MHVENLLLGEKLPQDSGVAYKYIYSTTIVVLTHVLVDKTEAWAHSQTAADELSKIKHITQGLYSMKLAFSDAKPLEITMW